MAVAPNSVTARGLVLAIKARLADALRPADDPVTQTYVRVVARPDPTYGNYKAEEGVAVSVHTAEPQPLSGAGRWGYLTNRVVEVHVCTMNLSDAAGTDELMVLAHLDLEERVADTLLDARPVTVQLPTGERVGVRIKWIPGGAEIERQIKVDPGTSLSVLLFDVEYVPPFTVS